jgi:hypothetical protein
VQLCFGSSGVFAIDIAHQQDELDELGITDTVKNPVGIASRTQDLAFFHQGKVLRNIALSGASFLNERLYLEFLQIQRTQNLQPRGMGNRFEYIRCTINIAIHKCNYFL